MRCAFRGSTQCGFANLSSLKAQVLANLILIIIFIGFSEIITPLYLSYSSNTFICLMYAKRLQLLMRQI